MAWTTPRTWVSAELVTATLLNAHIRDNLNAAFPLGPDAWTAHTPTVTQSTAVAKTVNWSRYQRTGRVVTWQFRLTMTAAGTAANRVTLSLPVAAATAVSVGVGSGLIYDASSGIKYVSCLALFNSTSLAFETDASTTDSWGASPNIALASGDVLLGSVTYEAAT